MTQVSNQNNFQGELFTTSEISPAGYGNMHSQNIQSHLVALVLAHSDISIELGNGCVALRISKKTLMRNSFGALSASEVIELSELTIIWSEWKASIVTILSNNSHFEKLERRLVH